MIWIIEERINSNQNLLRVKSGLDSLGINYIEVNVEKEEDRVLKEGFPLLKEIGIETLYNFLDQDFSFAYGSKEFIKRMSKYPITYSDMSNERFNLDHVNSVLKDISLNEKAITTSLLETVSISEPLFIRPNENSKLFDGKTFTPEEYDYFRNLHLNNKLFAKTSICISPIMDIIAEYRFFVVNGLISTASSYMSSSKYNIDLPIKDEIYNFTKQIVSKNDISKAFCVDIAETTNGLKVIEYNNINTSGLYNHNVLQLIKDINSLAP